jgi:uncharacterized oxidoreductase
MNPVGNVILITGGSSGIGLEMALHFHSLGNKVIVTGRTEEKLNEINNHYPDLITFRADLTIHTHLQQLAAFIKEHHSGLNILVNNAAVQYNYLFTEETDFLEKVDYETTANFTAPVKLTALLLPVLQKNRPASIINVSSGLAIAPKKSAAVYCATKAAIHRFTQALRYQLANSGIHVFELIPPLVDTPMTKGRGKSKISSQKLVQEFLRGFEKDKFEMYIGKSKLLWLINRISPAIAERIMKNGL